MWPYREVSRRQLEERKDRMEDADPFPWDLGEEVLLAELRELLEGEG